MIYSRRTRLVILTIGLSVHAWLLDPAAAEDFSVRKRGDVLDVEIDGHPFTSYLQADLAKPILYPVLGPHDIPMTRNWPMKKGVPGEATDHPHQKSIWFTHGSVNGVDFWTENRKSGRIVQTELLRADGGKDAAVIETANEWRDSAGKVLLSDKRLLRFSLASGVRAIDYRIELIASHGKVVFGDTKEGGMGIRTRTELQLKGGSKEVPAKGHSLNSEGVRDGAVWGKRANWIDYWAEIDGHTVGVAIFDHPDNPRHPTWWHARDYGLISANPFGIHDFEPGQQDHAGDIEIPEGKSIVLRYRFLFHEGDAEKASIANLYEEYSKD
jgi:hypothetical protein